MAIFGSVRTKSIIPHPKARLYAQLCTVLAAIALSACGAYTELADAPLVPLPPTYPVTAAPKITRLVVTGVPLPTAAAVPPALPSPPLAPLTPKSPDIVNSTPALAPTAPAPMSFTPAPIALHPPRHDLTALNEYQRGIAYTAVNINEYASPNSKHTLDEIFATGANYLSLLVTWYQKDVSSTEIYRADNTPTDADLKYVIGYAHAHGVKILLKPQVDFSQDLVHWRGEIDFSNESDWRAWFASYRAFIMHYAQFAQQNGVEEFSVGTELYATTRRTTDWRALIRAVRKVYTGLMTYSANHSGEEVQVRFWDDLDFIGVNVFYHLTNYRDPTLEQILIGWGPPVGQLTLLHENFPDKPIIFTEVGYPSLDRASIWPWNWQRVGEIDLQEQADLYEALFLTWWNNPNFPWFRGLFIWRWTTDPNQGGPRSGDYTPHNKPAEQVLEQWFGGQGR